MQIKILESGWGAWVNVQTGQLGGRDALTQLTFNEDL